MDILKLFGALIAALVIGGWVSKLYDDDQDYSHFNDKG